MTASLATVDDYDNMLRIMNEFRSDSPFTKEEYVSFLESLPSTIQIWVLRVDGKIVSTAKIMFEPKLIFKMATLAHIEDICTFSKDRKKGYGAMLVKHLIAVAKEKKCYKITLSCNIAVSPFYASVGFEQRGIQMSQLV